ncbi:Rab-GTPase-TBC domain [Carpediemonas membranifera]|uniref:Rab-GTPase-TBC domain n=1 Tax=Carpediemonas membranifera TaxID=201153 RepID=A0A8J6ARM9_9EUKA|nr:Rab-GTPase-TBC domain [Carpediemonas membranifera]|eukprot:KAG9390485.1 Rab-GTPase-TBC domain [Carpediemonas membranifera]
MTQPGLFVHNESSSKLNLSSSSMIERDSSSKLNRTSSSILIEREFVTNEAIMDQSSALERFRALFTEGHEEPAYMRPYLYMHFLGFLSDQPSYWKDEIEPHRALWGDILSQHEANLRISRRHGADPSHVVPTDTKYQLEAVEASMELVQKDLLRLFAGDEYFKTAKFTGDVTQILTMHSVYGAYHIDEHNQDWAYRQGYHVMASVVYFLVHHSRSVIQEHGTPLAKALIGDEENLVKDTFIIFRRLVRMLDCFYNHDSAGSASNLDEECHNMLMVIQSDEALFAKMKEPAGYEPSIFLNKWFRLMFAYQMSIPSTVLLWDYILASSITNMAEPLIMVRFIAAALLRKHRTTILEAEDGELIEFLSRSPALSDAEAFGLMNDAEHLSRRYTLPQLPVADSPAMTPKKKRGSTNSALPSKCSNCGQLDGATVRADDLMSQALPLLYEVMEDGDRRAELIIGLLCQARDALDNAGIH